MNNAATVSNSSSTTPVSLGASLKAGLIGALASAVACYLVYGIARAAGVEFVGAFNGPAAPAGPLPIPAILMANIVPGLIGSFVFFGFTKALRSPRTPWLVTSGVLATLSAIAPLTLGGASTGTGIALALMHFIAGAGIGGNLGRLVAKAA